MRSSEAGLLADIGGTNARFALQAQGGSPASVRVLHSADFPSLESAAKSYLAGVGARPKRGAFAVASPVTGDRIEMTNHPWSFSIDAMRERLALDDLVVVNDFEAIAWSIPLIPRDQVRRIGGGEAVAGAPVAIIGPGTGLGVAALIDGRPVASEGGHVTLPATDAREAEAIARIRARLGHVSAERALSGPGLCNLYRALGNGGEPPDPDEITRRALRAAEPRAKEALDMFCAMLGTVAGNLALTLGARGGVYIAGGIVRKLGEYFTGSRFRDRFEDKGRFRDYLEPIPVYVIEAEMPALLGLAALLEERDLAHHGHAP